MLFNTSVYSNETTLYVRGADLPFGPDVVSVKNAILNVTKSTEYQSRCHTQNILLLPWQ